MSKYSEKSENNWLKWSVVGVIALIVAITAVCSTYVIDPGYRGVMVLFGKVEPQSYINGVGCKYPFVSKMVSVDVRTQAMTDSTSTYTSDVQTAKLKYTCTYNLNPNNVYQLYENIGVNYESKTIVPVLADVLKNVIGKWQAQDLVNNREKASLAIVKSLNAQLGNKYFQNITFQLIDIDYSDKFESAIQDKVIAEQKAQEAVNNTRKVTEEANQKLITAKADAQAMEIKTEALAKNKGLTEYEAVQKWDGHLPQYMFGNSVPIIKLPANTDNQTNTVKQASAVKTAK